ncbi:MAG: four helix bundle protein [Acidobacteriota bacterium]|nr:four helix bundle protein [Acidobacteriota bacterium]
MSKKATQDSACFCSIAGGSASELEYQLLFARDLNLIKPEDHKRLALQITEIKRMRTVFVRKLTAESSILNARGHRQCRLFGGGPGPR